MTPGGLRNLKAAARRPPEELRPCGAILTPHEVELVRQRNPSIQIPFELHDRQKEVLRRLEYEVMCGGAKAGGKTIAGIYFLIQGNPDKPNHDSLGNYIPVNASYIFHPKYLGAVIRLNAKHLNDWVMEAKAAYRPYGGEYKESRMQFEFPSGAVIMCGHLDDSNAYMRYQGLNVVRFVVEEATQIPDKTRYVQIRSCCRSVYPEMREQLLLTCNPGGPGMQWVMDRFIEPKDRDGTPILGEDGLPIPPETRIVEEIKHPFEDRWIRIDRVFMPMNISHNPDVMKKDTYVASLATIEDEELRDAYLLGDWRIASGQYFKSWRPKHRPGEPPEALHVIPRGKERLLPWWPRIAGMDWGHHHDSAFFLAASDPEIRRLTVYKELVAPGMEPVEFGAEIARMCLPDLEGLESHSFNLWLSHEAFSTTRDDQSIATLIGAGIAKVIGRNLVHLPDVEVKKLEEEFSQSTPLSFFERQKSDEIFARIQSVQRMGITIRRAPSKRVIGWQYCREMLRWQRTGPPRASQFDPRMASEIAWKEGLQRYLAYCKLYEQPEEVLPKLLVVGPAEDDKNRPIPGSGGCPRLISAIPRLVRGEPPEDPEDVTKKHIQGASDCGDALRYLVVGYRGESAREPLEFVRQRVMSEWEKIRPGMTTADKIWIQRGLEEEARRKSPGGRLDVPRGGRRTRMLSSL